MKISKRAYYGLRAAMSLAIQKKTVSAHELSERENIPEEFLEKILQKLRRAGIVTSKKGVEGGYILARSPRSLTVQEILEVLDDPLRPITPPRGKGILPCATPSHCRTNEVWRILEKEIEQTLTKITLEELTAKKIINPKFQVPNKS